MDTDAYFSKDMQNKNGVRPRRRVCRNSVKHKCRFGTHTYTQCVQLIGESIKSFGPAYFMCSPELINRHAVMCVSLYVVEWIRVCVRARVWRKPHQTRLHYRCRSPRSRLCNMYCCYRQLST